MNPTNRTIMVIDNLNGILPCHQNQKDHQIHRSIKFSKPTRDHIPNKNPNQMPNKARLSSKPLKPQLKFINDHNKGETPLNPAPLTTAAPSHSIKFSNSNRPPRKKKGSD
ncbi:hypothetical protein Droror1_Dr00027601 [Drosera rotundifolia]